jgi:hypothetical protein
MSAPSTVHLPDTLGVRSGSGESAAGAPDRRMRSGAVPLVTVLEGNSVRRVGGAGFVCGVGCAGVVDGPLEEGEPGAELEPVGVAGGLWVVPLLASVCAGAMAITASSGVMSRRGFTGLSVVLAGGALPHDRRAHPRSPNTMLPWRSGRVTIDNIGDEERFGPHCRTNRERTRRGRRSFRRVVMSR